MKSDMQKLSAKKEEIMHHFWEHGAMFVRELVDLYPEPKPHFNTLSTMVRELEAIGYLAHKSFGSTFQYYAVVSAEEFRSRSLQGLVSKYYNNSILGAVSALVESGSLSESEIEQLVELINKKSVR